MANCSLNRNILKDSSNCGYSLLKVIDVYLANYSEITASLGEDGNEVTAITMANSGKVYHIEPSKDSASYTTVCAERVSNNLEDGVLSECKQTLRSLELTKEKVNGRQSPFNTASATFFRILRCLEIRVTFTL